MGSTRPQSDYTVGLLYKVFTQDESDKLWNYSSSLRPFLFTPNLSFLFLIYEAKSGEEGLNKAHLQNIHSASIAVRAIIELYSEAFGESDPDRVSELYGQILIFTISHNHSIAYLYGHYTTISEDFPKRLEFRRHGIGLFSLNMNGGRDRFKTYNFVRNVYEKFAPEYRKRIKDAVAYLKSPGQRTGPPPSASSSALEESDSQANSQETPQEDVVFQVPGEPASAAQKRQQNRITAQLQQENKKLQEKNDSLQDHYNRLVHVQQEQLQQQQEQLRQQLEQSKAQQEQYKEQMEQYKEIIEMLKQQKPGNS